MPPIAEKDFFISYTGVDRARAEWVAKILKDEGFTTIYQSRDFIPGGNFVSDIQRALLSTQCTIMLLSPDYFRSPYTELEWTASLALDPAFQKGRLWPLQVRPCQPPGLLAAIHYTTLPPDESEAVEVLRVNAHRVRRRELPEGLKPFSASFQGLQPEEDYRRSLSKRLEDRLSSEIGTSGTSGIPLRLLEPYIDLTIPMPAYEQSQTRKRTAFEAYIKYNRTVFLGEAGSGKSTFLRRLALDLARRISVRLPGLESEEGSRLPIYVSLGSFSLWLQDRPVKNPTASRDTRELCDYIFDFYVSEFFFEDSRAVIETALRMGKAAVLLDGLDEIPAEARKRVHAAIQGLLVLASDANRYVITCRTQAYRKGWLGPTWEELTLERLETRQVEKHIDLWESEISRFRSKNFQSLKSLPYWPEIVRLSETPLILSLLAGQHYRNASTLASRARLFNSVIDELIWGWDDLKGSEAGETPELRRLLERTSFEPANLRPWLDEISFRTLRDPHQPAGVVPRSMVTSAFAIGSDAWMCEFLELLKLRTGLFMPGTDEKNEIRFCHTAFQDFMAGAHLARQKNFARTVTVLLPINRRLRDAVIVAVGDLVQLQRKFESPVLLAHGLSIESVEKNEPWKLSMAGDVLLELGLRNLRKVPTGAQVLLLVTKGLAGLLESGDLSPEDRSRAGDTLAQLGDPRFEPDCFYLPQGEAPAPPGFVEIPAGPFTMGSDLEDFPDERGNTGMIEIPYPLWVGRYPITVAQFAEFISEHGYDNKDWWEDFGWAWRVSAPETPASFPPTRVRSLPWKWTEQRRFKNRPVTGVCWFEARAYTQWLDHKLRLSGRMPIGHEARLPTEAEWEKAARSGSTTSRYPWGVEDWDSSRGNFLESSISHPTTVGMYPRGASPLGVHDLAGNVLEWTLSQSKPYPYSSTDGRNKVDETTGNEARIVRGGSFRKPCQEGRCAARPVEQPAFAQDDLGFRVVISMQLRKSR